MRVLPFVFDLSAGAGLAFMPARNAQRQDYETKMQEAHYMSSLTGKTIRWTFVNGSMPGTIFEHSFNEDGSVTWRIVDGQHKGASAREKSYGAVKVNENTWVISYLAASGHTLTVVLNLENRRAFAFASNDKSWDSMNGAFEILK